MSVKLFLNIWLFLFLLFSETLSQSIPFILENTPKSFVHIESQLEEEEFNAVLTACSEILENEKDHLVKGIAHFYIGQAQDLRGKMGEAIDNYQQAIDYFSFTKYEKGLSAIYLKLGDLYFFRQSHLEAETYYQLAADLSEKLEVHDILLDVLQKKSLINTAAQKSEDAVIDLKKALDIAVLLNDSTTSNLIYNQISTNFQAAGQLDSAIFYFKKSIAFKQEMDDPAGMISDHSALGNLYRERGDYEEAIRQLNEGLSIAEQETDTFSMMTINAELGKIYTDQVEDLPVAKDYFKRALFMAEKKNIDYVTADCKYRLGMILQKQNLDHLAAEKYESALEIFNKLNNKTSAAEVLLKLYPIYNNEDQYERAKELLEEALSYRNDGEDLTGTLTIKLALSEIEIDSGDPKKGLKYALQCLPLYEGMNDKAGLKALYILLVKGYEKQKDFKKALSYHKKYYTINNDLMSAEKAEAIKGYDLLVTEKELTKKNQALQTSKLELLQKNNQLLMLGAGTVLLLLVAGFLFFVFRKNKQVNAQRIEVLKKEQETQRLKAVIEGEEKERKRMARELHDGLGAVLATVKMEISGISHQQPDIQAMPGYQRAENLIDDACRTVREISHDLMPYALEQQGLEFAITDLCQAMSRHSDVSFDFNYFGEEEPLDDVVKTTVFRIAQELLKNVIKHAEAEEVLVQLTIEDNELILIVEDDGKGFDPAKMPNGIGIGNIRSRVDYLNGKLDIDSKIGQGSTFTIQLPIKQDKNLSND